MTRILVVEDNADLAFGLRNNLEIEGYAVTVAEDGSRGLRAAREESPELLILDLMLPEMSGFSVLNALRAEGHDVPVLILTAKQPHARPHGEHRLRSGGVGRAAGESGPLQPLLSGEASVLPEAVLGVTFQP